MSCRAVHSAVGCSVTLKCTSRRRPWLSTTNTNRTRKVAVGTVKKSNAIRSGAWFFKNVRHACDGGRRDRSIYFETVACETVTPSFSSSPWILGAPQRGLARLIRRIRSRSSRPIAGRPRPASTLPCPVAPEALTVAPHHRLGPAARPAANFASSSRTSTAAPRRAGPSLSAVAAAGAPSRPPPSRLRRQ
jgi:hypothetical protein